MTFTIYHYFLESIFVPISILVVHALCEFLRKSITPDYASVAVGVYSRRSLRLAGENLVLFSSMHLFWEYQILQ